MSSSRSAWMLGAGGMGVGPLAIYLKSEGWDVRGCDDAMGGPMAAQLATAGIPLQASLETGNWTPQLVAHTSAIKTGHPLREQAMKANCRIIRRGELLAEQASGRRLVAICGSHGKTTTCGMVITALTAAGADFGYVLGGLFRDPSLAPARATTGSDWLVAEVDESDGTIGGFSPEVTVAVNLDWDHPDYYRTEADLERVFAELFQRTRSLILIPHGNARLHRLTQGVTARVLTVGEGGDFDLRAVAATHGSSDVEVGGLWAKGKLTLPVAGSFNRSNAGFALAVAQHIAGQIGSAPLGAWTGIRRRQDTLFERPGLRVLADYAHHPTEIAALLGLLRETHLGKLVVVFQPHRHTRTRQYAAAFREALSVADTVLVLPVYAAGETPVEGGSSENILLGAGTDKFQLVLNRTELPRALQTCIKDSDAVVAFVGAGDIEKDATSFARDCWRAPVAPHAPADFANRVTPFLSSPAVLRRHEPLARRVTLGVGGAAEWYAEPVTVDDCVALLRAAAECDLPVFTLGRGSNLLVADDGYAGLVIHLSSEHWGALKKIGDLRLQVGGGVRLKELCGLAAREGLAGFEFLEGIPGTVGGSLRMNAGAMGSWIFDRVESVEWLGLDGHVRTAKRSALDATYRDCPQLHGAVVLSAVLIAEARDEPSNIRAKMEVMATKRRATQPRDASAGCVFRNPPADKAGRLIEMSGLKGDVQGGAKVSPIHANFIVNTGEATAADILLLLRRVRGVVKAERGIELEPEIIALGKEWRDLL